MKNKLACLMLIVQAMTVVLIILKGTFCGFCNRIPRRQQLGRTESTFLRLYFYKSFWKALFLSKRTLILPKDLANTMKNLEAKLGNKTPLSKSFPLASASEFHNSETLDHLI